MKVLGVVVNKDQLIGAGMLLFLAGCTGSCFYISSRPDTEATDKSECIERVKDELIAREGDKAVNKEDIERYYSEFKSRCNL